MNRITTQKKKHRMLRMSVLFSLLLTVATLAAQTTTTTVEYTYDEAGNRISRKVIVLKNTQSQASAEFTRPTVNDLSDQKIIIYPNPTKGILGIEIKGGNPKDQVTIQAYSIQGVLLTTIQGSVGFNRMDIGDYPSGQYILRLVVGDRRVEYKIIKE